MMRRLIAALMVLLAFSCAAMAERGPAVPADMLPVLDVQLPGGIKCPVYSGPGEEFLRAANGKASVSTNDWVQVFGSEGNWVMIRYGIDEERTRIGYLSESELPEDFFLAPLLRYQWEYGRAEALRAVEMTDDPFGSQAVMTSFDAGTVFITLHRMDDWWYVETIDGTQARGFIRAEDLKAVPVPYAETEQYAQAAAMLEDAGISCTVQGLYEKGLNRDLWFSLDNGGRIYYYAYGTDREFDPYDVTPWNFNDPQSMSDGDASKFIHHYLNLAAVIQQGNAPEEHLHPDYMGDLGQWNIEAAVSNILLRLESFGDQGLRLMLDALAAHDGQDTLNSLRARLASRILGALDKTPVDPAEGCAWYDALAVSQQDDLPRVDAALYEENPLYCAAAQALIDENDREYAIWPPLHDVDWGKARNVVALKVYRTKESSGGATIWANVSQSCYALYDGETARLVSGSWIPSRIEMKKDEGGAWILSDLIQAEDGTRYAPSIREFCGGDRELADQMMQGGYAGTDEYFLRYLSAHSFDSVVIEE